MTNEVLAGCDVSKSPVGQKPILAIAPHTKLKKTGKSPDSLRHWGCPNKTVKFKAAFIIFVSDYKAGYQALLRVDLTAIFQDGAIPPASRCISFNPGSLKSLADTE